MQTMQTVQTQLPYTTSYTPMLPGTRWHMRRDDFIDICDGDVACADALRYFEMRCHYLGEDLRQEHGIPEDRLPADDDLWIDASVRQVERGTLKVQGKSTYALRLTDEPKDEDAVSLIKLGFLKRRIIARCDERISQLTPKATRWRDRAGEFVIVVDRHGNYIGDDDSQQNAICDGYTRIVWQYLYCIDAINAAIAKRAWMEPPQSMERWKSVIGRSDIPRKGGVSAKTTMTEHAECKDDLNIRGGTSQVSMSSRNKDIIDKTALSIPALYDLEALRTAPWCAETLIGLSSSRLAVPDAAKCDEDEYRRDWFDPAQQLIEELCDLASTRAWERIDRHIAGMLSGPTWYAQERKNNTPITLRHVVGYKDGKEVGYYWQVVEAELAKAAWWPDVTTPYDGPPVVEEHADYSAGYAGVEEQQEAPPVEEIEVVAGQDEVSEEAAAPPVIGMDEVELRRVADLILEEYPMLDIRSAPIAPGRFAIGINRGKGRGFIDIDNADQWENLGPEDQIALDHEAVPYGRATMPGTTQLAHGPPGNTMESEGSP